MEKVYGKGLAEIWVGKERQKERGLPWQVLSKHINIFIMLFLKFGLKLLDDADNKCRHVDVSSFACMFVSTCKQP